MSDKLPILPTRGKYAVHSLFRTWQGEGVHMGKLAVFARFSACNVWNGREEDRERDAEKSACARICDTNFLGIDRLNGGGYFTEDQLIEEILKEWGHSYVSKPPFVVFTGGEPMLQLQEQTVSRLHGLHAYVAVETNGSLPVPKSVDWVAVAPKPPMPLVQDRIDELKVLSIFDPALFKDVRATHKWIQPTVIRGNSIDTEAQVKRALLWTAENPEWRLGIQAHKVWKLP